MFLNGSSPSRPAAGEDVTADGQTLPVACAAGWRGCPDADYRGTQLARAVEEKLTAIVARAVPGSILKIAVPMTTADSNTTPDFVLLYRRAFEEFGAAALWSSRPVPNPTPEDALAITNSLRVEGNLRARRLAEQIEQACRAAV